MVGNVAAANNQFLIDFACVIEHLTRAVEPKTAHQGRQSPVQQSVSCVHKTPIRDKIAVMDWIVE